MLVVCMTSWKKRIDKVKIVVDSIMKNTIQPDRLYLSLSIEEFPNKELGIPKDLVDHFDNDERLIFNWVDGKNTKTMKKVFPVLKYLNDDDIIITADDDIPLSDRVQELNSQMETLKMRNITQEELIQALNTSSMAMWQDISTNEGMVRYLSSAELMYGNASVMNSRLDRMNRITADEVREVVHRFLRADNMKTFYILPSSMKK